MLQLAASRAFANLSRPFHTYTTIEERKADAALTAHGRSRGRRRGTDQTSPKPRSTGPCGDLRPLRPRRLFADSARGARCRHRRRPGAGNFSARLEPRARLRCGAWRVRTVAALG